MLGILETEVVGDLADGFRCAEEHFFGEVDDFVLDVLLGGFAGLFLDKVAEVVGREENLVGKVFDGRKPFSLGLVVLEIIVEEVLKFCQHILIGSLAGGELAFVEAHAVVQKQLDVACDETLAELVDGVGEFQFDFAEAVEDDSFLFIGKVKCLAGRVREERVRLDFLSECGAFDEVGMEDNAFCQGLDAFSGFDFCHLPGGEADDGALLVVIAFSAVADVAAFDVFEKEGIDTVIDGEVWGESGGFCKVDDIDERVEGFQTEKLVVLADVVHLDKFFFHGIGNLV